MWDLYFIWVKELNIQKHYFTMDSWFNFDQDKEDLVSSWSVVLTKEEEEQYKDLIFEKYGNLYLDHPDLPISKIL